MNDTLTSPAAIREEIARLELELAQHQADVVLMQRLKTAQADLARARKQLDKLADALLTAEQTERDAASDALAANYRNFSVAVTSDPFTRSGALHDAYTVSYEQRRYCHHVRDSICQGQSVSGFQALDPQAMVVLLDRYPEALPPAILALGDSPTNAMSAYMLHRRRGYVAA